MTTKQAAAAAPAPDAPKLDEKALAKQKKADEAAAAKLAKQAAKEKAKKEAEAAKLAAKQIPKDTQNGIARPKTGVTHLVWLKADEMSKALGKPVERAALTKELDGKVETGTVHTQYGRWKKYYGLTESKADRQARLKIARDEKTAKAEKAKAEKAAAKVAKEQAELAAKQQAEAAKAQPGEVGEVGEQAQQQQAA